MEEPTGTNRGDPVVDSIDVGRRVFSLLSSGDDSGQAASDETGDRAASQPIVTGYELISEIGAGGASTVYRAVQTRTAREVAVKIFRGSISRSFTDDSGDRPLTRVARIEREIELLTTIDLAVTPRLLDWGFTTDDRMYLVTEYIDGVTLSEHMREVGPTRRERVMLIRDIARGAHELHQRGVIHRDLKPSNVLVDSKGRIRLLDLGIAAILRTAEDSDSSRTLTSEGSPIGSPAFMSPEQARGDRAHVSVRTDVYGLGATLFYLLTDGETPHAYEGSSNDQILRTATQPGRDIRSLAPDLDRSLAAIVRKATSFDAADRYDGADELADDLDRWLDDVPIAWQAPSAWTWTKYFVRTHRMSAIAAAVAFLAVVGMTVTGSIAAAQASVAQEAQQLADKQAQMIADREAFMATYDDVLLAGVAAIRQNVDAGVFGEAVNIAVAWEELVKSGKLAGIDVSNDHSEELRAMAVRLVEIVADYDTKGREEFLTYVKENID